MKIQAFNSLIYLVAVVLTAKWFGWRLILLFILWGWGLLLQAKHHD